MKGFLCIPVALLFAFSPMSEKPTAEKYDQIKQVLSSNPWKQVTYTVSPALAWENDEEVNDLYAYLDEENRNNVIKFDVSGVYYIVKNQPFNDVDMMFAARNVKASDVKEKVKDKTLYNVTEDVSINIMETGSWRFTDEGNLALMSDNGRMKEQILEVEQMDVDRFVINFTQEIGGEEHTFTQAFESQPFIELGF